MNPVQVEAPAVLVDGSGAACGANFEVAANVDADEANETGEATVAEVADPAEPASMEQNAEPAQGGGDLADDQ